MSWKKEPGGALLPKRQAVGVPSRGVGKRREWLPRTVSTYMGGEMWGGRTEVTVNDPADVTGTARYAFRKAGKDNEWAKQTP